MKNEQLKALGEAGGKFLTLESLVGKAVQVRAFPLPRPITGILKKNGETYKVTDNSPSNLIETAIIHEDNLVTVTNRQGELEPELPPLVYVDFRGPF